MKEDKKDNSTITANSSTNYWIGTPELNKAVLNSCFTTVRPNSNIVLELDDVTLGLLGLKGEGPEMENKTEKRTVQYNGSSCKDKLTFPRIEKVIFNPPATVVIWSDGTKTVVKSGGYSKKGKKDKFSEEYGLAMAIAKKFCGNRSQFLKLVKNADRPQEEK